MLALQDGWQLGNRHRQQCRGPLRPKAVPRKPAAELALLDSFAYPLAAAGSDFAVEGLDKRTPLGRYYQYKRLQILITQPRQALKGSLRKRVYNFQIPVSIEDQ